MYKYQVEQKSFTAFYHPTSRQRNSPLTFPQTQLPNSAKYSKVSGEGKPGKESPVVLIGGKKNTVVALKDLVVIWLVVEPTLLKNMLVKTGSSSPGMGENNKKLKP